MNNKHLLALAIGLLGVSGVQAQGMTRAEFGSGKDSINTHYKDAKSVCASLAGNEKDVCRQEAKGSMLRARADLEARNEPSLKHSFRVDIVKAETAYALAKEKCDDLAGNAKDVCVKEAKAIEVAARADAIVRLKAAEGAQGNRAARVEAKDEKLDAEYKVAREKCDTFSGDAKDTCLNQAKTRFSK